MNLSDVPLDTLNFFAGQKLGQYSSTCNWQLSSPSVTHDHVCIEPARHTQTSGVMDWETPHRCACGYVWDSSPHQYHKHDFTTPEGMKMLLKRMQGKPLVVRWLEEPLNMWGAYFWDGSQNHSAPLSQVQKSTDLARVILEVFCLSEGFTV